MSDGSSSPCIDFRCDVDAGVAEVNGAGAAKLSGKEVVELEMLRQLSMSLSSEFKKPMISSICCSQVTCC